MRARLCHTCGCAAVTRGQHFFMRSTRFIEDKRVNVQRKNIKGVDVICFSACFFIFTTFKINTNVI